jgi:hypothetical protein
MHIGREIAEIVSRNTDMHADAVERLMPAIFDAMKEVLVTKGMTAIPGVVWIELYLAQRTVKIRQRLCRMRIKPNQELEKELEKLPADHPMFAKKKTDYAERRRKKKLLATKLKRLGLQRRKENAKKRAAEEKAKAKAYKKFRIACSEWYKGQVKLADPVPGTKQAVMLLNGPLEGKVIDVDFAEDLVVIDGWAYRRIPQYQGKEEPFMVLNETRITDIYYIRNRLIIADAVRAEHLFSRFGGITAAMRKRWSYCDHMAKVYAETAKKRQAEKEAKLAAEKANGSNSQGQT